MPPVAWDDFEPVDQPPKAQGTDWNEFEPEYVPPSLPAPPDWYQKLSPAEKEDYGQTAQAMLPESPAATIGKGAKLAGEKLKNAAGAYAFEAVGDSEDQAKQLGVDDDTLRKLGVLTEPSDPGVTPLEQGQEALPTPARALSKGAYGLVETVPKLAGVVGAEAMGIPAPVAAGAVFGSTPEGFNPKEAAVAAALPFVGKYSGEIVGAIARKFGVDGAQALRMWKSAGAITGAAGYLGAIDESEIQNLPPEQRDKARIEMVAGLMGQSLLGPMGVEKPTAGEVAGMQLGKNVRNVPLPESLIAFGETKPGQAREVVPPEMPEAAAAPTAMPTPKAEVPLEHPEGFGEKSVPEGMEQLYNLPKQPAPEGLTLAEFTKETADPLSKRLGAITDGKANGTIAAYWAAVNDVRDAADPIAKVKEWGDAAEPLQRKGRDLRQQAEDTGNMDYLMKSQEPSHAGGLIKEGLEAIANWGKTYGFGNDVINAARQEVARLSPKPKDVTPLKGDVEISGEADASKGADKQSTSLEVAKPTNLPKTIRYTIRPNGKFDISAQGDEGLMGMHGNLTRKQLEQIVGKPMADQIAGHKGDEPATDQFGTKTGVFKVSELPERLANVTFPKTNWPRFLTDYWAKAESKTGTDGGKAVAGTAFDPERLKLAGVTEAQAQDIIHAAAQRAVPESFMLDRSKYTNTKLALDDIAEHPGTPAPRMMAAYSQQLQDMGAAAGMSRGETVKAVKRVAKENGLRDWPDTRDAEDYEKLIAAFKQDLAPAKEVNPATTGPTTAPVVSREEIGNRPGAKKSPLTPMMEQHAELKKQAGGALVAVRLGDFYEFFGDDAKKAAERLKIALTKRGEVPMAGIPFHAKDAYFKKLTDAGETVAVAEAKEAPKPGELAKREITETFKPEAKPVAKPPGDEPLGSHAGEDVDVLPVAKGAKGLESQRAQLRRLLHKIELREQNDETAGDVLDQDEERKKTLLKRLGEVETQMLTGRAPKQPVAPKLNKEQLRAKTEMDYENAIVTSRVWPDGTPVSLEGRTVLRQRAQHYGEFISGRSSDMPEPLPMKQMLENDREEAERVQAQEAKQAARIAKEGSILPERPKTTPPVAPVVAAAQVAEQIKKTSAEVGPQGAKAVKTELVDRLEKAIEDAPAQKDLTEAQQKALSDIKNRVPLKQENSGLKRTQAQRIEAEKLYMKAVAAEKKVLADKALATGLQQVTIDIPGDGTFTIWNTKEALTEVLDRAKRISTSTATDKGYTTSGISKEDSDWVRKQLAEQQAKADPTTVYYVHAGNKWEPVAGKPVELADYPGIEFFVHPPQGGGKGYSVTEARSGKRVGGVETSEKKAVAAANEILKGLKFSPERMKEIVKGEVATDGLSPRYSAAAEQPKGPGMVGMGGAMQGEFGQTPPTIEDQISGKLAPPRPREPVPTEPAATPVLNGWQDAFKNFKERLQGTLGGFAGKTFPRTTLKARHLGELGARWISSRIAAKPTAEVFAAEVLGNSGVDPVHFGAALTEDNLRSIKQTFLDKADEAANREEIMDDIRGQMPEVAERAADGDPEARKELSQMRREITRLSKLTDEDVEKFTAKAQQVKSFIGADGFPFKTEAEYSHFLDDPHVKEAVARHRDLWDNVVDPQYRQAMMIDPDFELPSRGLETGARINLRAVIEGEPARDIVGGVGRGNLLGTLRKKSPFGIQAKGTGEAYHLNYYDLMENTFGRQLEIANKNEFETALVKAKQAVIGEPGQQVNIEGQPAVEFPLKRQRAVIPGAGAVSQNKSIYVNKKLALEYRIGANVDGKPPMNVLTMMNKVLNTAAISGLTDATVHITNLGSGLATLPGTSGRLLHDSLLSAVPGRPDVWVSVFKALTMGAKDNRAQLASLAEIGALREGGFQVEKSKPKTWIHAGSDVIRWMDQNTRLVLDDAFKNLAKDGVVENTETNRREFINQMGQYNKRAQGYYKRWFRDTGFGPFVTAGTTFNTLGVRGITLNPGVKASSGPAALALRVNMLAKLVGTAGTIGVLNYLLTKDKKDGGVMGRPGIPFGAIDLGTNDKNGRPQYLPILGMIGPARGLRVTGARGFIESKLRGLPTAVALDAAERDIINSLVAPFAGPPIRFAALAATGQAPAKGVQRQFPVVPPGQNQAMSDFRNAVIEASPITAGIKKAMEPGSTGWSEVVKSQLPRFTLQPGKPSEMMRDYAGIVRRAQANGYIEDVIGRARKMEPGVRKQYLIDSVSRLESMQDRQKAIQQFKYRKVL